MPEQISKYPEVTLRILKDAGARCGEGVEQKILKKCPPEQFCALPTGEVCVYGIKEIPQMTQITTQELARIVCPREQQSLKGAIALSFPEMAIVGMAFVGGLVVGEIWRKFKRKGAE
jgi:hypothetical protein